MSNLSAGYLGPYVVTSDATRRLSDQHYSVTEGGTRSYFEQAEDRTLPWTKLQISFNSLNQRSVRLGLGAWDQTAGQLWIDDVRVTSDPLLNLLRRKDLPTKLTTSSGRVLVPGQDVGQVRDRRLGRSSYRGNYDTYHRAPSIRIKPRAGLTEGTRVRLAAYHTIVTTAGQVGCSWHHPKVLDLMREVHRRAAKRIRPDGYFVDFEEIRTGGWEPSDRAYGSSSRALAAHFNQVAADVRDVTGVRRVYVWSDMLDPTQNAVRRYAQVRGSLKGTARFVKPRGVTIVNWKSGPRLARDAKRSSSYFEKRGFRQLIAGFYDEPVAANYQAWSSGTHGVSGITGSMYTTWTRDFSSLAEFGASWWR